MNRNLEIQDLIDHISSLIQSYDDDSPLEVLFSHYYEFCYPDRQNDTSLQQDLRRILHSVAPECEDQIMNLVYIICFHYERISFIEGLKVGVRLATELIK